MKRLTKTGLKLSTETIRNLDVRDLGRAAGGLPNSTDYGCLSYDILCETVGCSTGRVCTNSSGPCSGPTSLC
jgi:hypothetical protein